MKHNELRCYFESSGLIDHTEITDIRRFKLVLIIGIDEPICSDCYLRLTELAVEPLKSLDTGQDIYPITRLVDPRSKSPELARVFDILNDEAKDALRAGKCVEINPPETKRFGSDIDIQRVKPVGQWIHRSS